jgi:hypothetical protein
LYGTVAGYVYAHSRVQFHPAATALLYSVMFLALMTAALFVLSLIFIAFGISGVRIDFETNAAVFGPALFGELVRGHARTLLRCRAEEWCFPAIGVAGFATGGVFGVLMTLKWGELPSLEPLWWGAAGVASYLLLGWLIRYAQRKESGSAR